MSLAKVKTVQKSRQDQGKCERCAEELPAGSAYRWFVVGFRSKYKHKRCMKAKCTPRQSERESSSLSEIYAANESWEDSVASVDDIDDVAAAWESVQGTYREYADNARAAADAWEHGNSQLEERADQAEQAADELEGHEIETGLPERQDFDSEDEHQAAVQEFITDQAYQASEVLGGVDI